jgi:hypothetical protein
MLRILTVHCSCPSVVTSVSELLNSFDFTFERGGTMNGKHLGLLLLAGCLFVPQLQAQIKHIEMRVEGMT